MPIDKSLLTGSTTMLILKLLEEKDMYGYEMIATLAQRSNHAFDMKAGTLYPLLHNLEKAGFVTSYEETAENERTRKYYHLTEGGRGALQTKAQEWYAYADAVHRVLKGGACCGAG